MRQAIADYTSARTARQHGRRSHRRYQSGGVNALMLAVQALVDAGDEVVVVTPVWPNLTAQPADHGRTGALRAAAASDGEWRWIWLTCWRR